MYYPQARCSEGCRRRHAAQFAGTAAARTPAPPEVNTPIPALTTPALAAQGHTQGEQQGRGTPQASPATGSSSKGGERVGVTPQVGHACNAPRATSAPPLLCRRLLLPNGRQLLGQTQGLGQAQGRLGGRGGLARAAQCRRCRRRSSRRGWVAALRARVGGCCSRQLCCSGQRPLSAGPGSGAHCGGAWQPLFGRSSSLLGTVQCALRAWIASLGGGSARPRVPRVPSVASPPRPEAHLPVFAAQGCMSIGSSVWRGAEPPKTSGAGGHQGTVPRSRHELEARQPPFHTRSNL